MTKCYQLPTERLPSPSDPPKSPTTPSTLPPSSEQPRPVTQRLRDHPQFKALKAAFNMVNNQDDLDLSDEAHAAILDEDVSDLMCALGLKE